MRIILYTAAILSVVGAQTTGGAGGVLGDISSGEKNNGEAQLKSFSDRWSGGNCCFRSSWSR